MRRADSGIGAKAPRGALFLMGAILLEVAATLSLKGALSNPWLYAVLVIGYASAFAMFSLALRAGFPLVAAYGIWAALGVVLTACLSAVLFAEQISPLVALGIAIIVVGVVLVETGASTGQGEHPEREAGRR